MARGRSIRDLFVRIGIDADDTPLRDIDRGVDRLKSNFRTLRNVVIGVLGAGRGRGFLLKLSGEFEQTEVAFETMLGSAEKAKMVLNDLFQFAAKTPFEIRGVLAAARQLLAFGIAPEKLIENLTTLGNVAAGTVGPGQSLQENFAGIARNFGQVRTQMRLLGRDSNDFANRGIPIFEEVAKVMGVSVEAIRKLGSEGSISFDVVEQAFANMSKDGGRFFNLMEKQSRTFLGIWSNIKDIVVLTAKDLGKTLLPQAKEVQLQFLKFLEVNKKIIQQRGKKIFTEIGKGILFALKITKSFISTLVEFTGIVGGLENAIKLATAALLIMFSVSMLSGIGSVAIGLFKVATAFTTIGNAAAIAQIKAFAFPLLVGIALLALGLIIDDIRGHFQGEKSLTGLIVAAFAKQIPDAIKITKGSLSDLNNDTLEYVFTMQKLNSFIFDLGDRVGDLKKTIKDFFDIDFTGGFVSGFNKLADFIFPGKGKRREKGEPSGGFIPHLTPAISGTTIRVPLPPTDLGNFKSGQALPPITFSGDVIVNTQPGADAEEIAETTVNAFEKLWDGKMFPAHKASRSTDLK